LDSFRAGAGREAVRSDEGDGQRKYQGNDAGNQLDAGNFFIGEGAHDWVTPCSDELVMYMTTTLNQSQASFRNFLEGPSAASAVIRIAALFHPEAAQ
jgi:hypothetical protein